RRRSHLIQPSEPIGVSRPLAQRNVRGPRAGLGGPLLLPESSGHPRQGGDPIKEGGPMTSPSPRTALVTGASSGIGLATARALVASGCTVYGTSRRPGSIAESDRVPGVEYLPLDLTDPASIRRCAAAAGDVDVLVNNAGESQSGPFEELPAEDLTRLFQLNVLGAVQLSQAVLPGMRARGYGRVVMVEIGRAHV